MTEIDGWTAAGFEGARDAFETNFAEGADVGAAFSAYHRGEKVVDLWGGTACVDEDRPWVEDTVMPVFSTTKGWTAMAANQLIARGLLDPAAPVARYWPEFARDGKEAVTVEHILSHRAGLAWCDATLGLEEVLAWDPVIAALEAQAPHYEPGTSHGYHALTFGWLVGEVIRRVDGRTVGTYIREEIADPLGLDLWIGIPAEIEPRVGRFIGSLGTPSPEDLGDIDPAIADLVAPFLGAEGVLTKALGAGLGAFDDFSHWNSPAVHRAEIPAANGICDARSLARLYAACIGEVDGQRVLDEARLDDAITQRTEGPNTILLNMDIQFGLGFMLHSSIMPLGGPRSFGHFGAGGSMGWADPDAGFAFGYVMNKMAMGLAGDERSMRLVDACYAAR